MRYLTIFLLNFQSVFERRGVSFIWFLITLFNPLIMLFYWRGALQGNAIKGWHVSSVSTYYFLLVIVAALLMSHIEDQVAHEDIEQGGLVRYILKPFSYYWFHFFHEIPYRILQGFFGIVTLGIVALIFRNVLSLSFQFPYVLFALFSGICAYFLSFTFKMLLGFSAFWFTDARGFFQFIEIVVITSAGYILPLDLMPQPLLTISEKLPFAYMIYYPVVILQGRIPVEKCMSVIFWQLFWIGIFLLLYKIVWKTGIKKFTGMGQ